MCEEVTFIFCKAFFFFNRLIHCRAVQVSNNGIISQLIITNNNIVPFYLPGIH